MNFFLIIDSPAPPEPPPPPKYDESPPPPEPPPPPPAPAEIHNSVTPAGTVKYPLDVRVENPVSCKPTFMKMQR
ncbi:hypothetical protein FC553_18585 [Escherichia coli]|nr:hypothetical protein [Escherichia coli]